MQPLMQQTQLELESTPELVLLELELLELELLVHVQPVLVPELEPDERLEQPELAGQPGLEQREQPVLAPELLVLLALVELDVPLVVLALPEPRAEPRVEPTQPVLPAE